MTKRLALFAAMLLLCAGCAEEQRRDTPLKPGMVVTLKTGWQRMTIEKIEDGKVYCVWEVEENNGFGFAKAFRRDVFDAHTVQPVPGVTMPKQQP